MRDFAEARHRGLRLELTIGGRAEGRSAAQLRRLVADHGVVEAVWLRGEVDEATRWQLLAEASCLVSLMR